MFHTTTTGIWRKISGLLQAADRLPPVAIPAKIGAPSLIKHVFVIIRENRTYDQILGDVAGGNGDPSLAVFGDSCEPTAPYPV